jgi:N-acetyltransferase
MELYVLQYGNKAKILMSISFQPTLKNEWVIAEPLLSIHFDELYAAANDPLIWEQHPNKNRWQLPDFKNYFEGAIKSEGAFLIRDAKSKEVIGSSRFSDYLVDVSTVSIGYTFFVRSCWGNGYNYVLKRLMLNHIFNYVDTVHFYIGAVNKRSQISIERLGAQKIGEKETAYYGESPKLDYVYAITKEEWKNSGQ